MKTGLELGGRVGHSFSYSFVRECDFGECVWAIVLFGWRGTEGEGNNGALGRDMQMVYAAD